MPPRLSSQVCATVNNIDNEEQADHVNAVAQHLDNTTCKPCSFKVKIPSGYGRIVPAALIRAAVSGSQWAVNNIMCSTSTSTSHWLTAAPPAANQPDNPVNPILGICRRQHECAGAGDSMGVEAARYGRDHRHLNGKGNGQNQRYQLYNDSVNW